MISVTNLSMRFGGKILFSKVNFQLNPNHHYGLVGANGSGKSTLIKILTKELTPEKGEVSTPSQLSIGTLKQDHFHYENETILDVVVMGRKKLWSALKQREKLLNTAHFDEKECELLATLEKEIEQQEGYSASSEAGDLLEGLGIPTKIQTNPLKTLSGGYKLRVLLAQVLFSRPDLLLLDEPTNHLDLFSIRWLEGYLKNFPGTLLLSSHDRTFLNNTCDSIVDIDYGNIKIYKGNYTQFLESKEQTQELKQATLEKQEKRKQHLQDFVDRFGAKASKARQAQSKMNLIEKIDTEIDSLDLATTSRKYPSIAFTQIRPSGMVPLTVKAITKHFNKPVLENVSFEIPRGTRTAILGANGVGKSTLLEIITGHSKADSGQVAWGHATAFAYFPQDHARELSGNMTLLEWLRQWNREAAEERLRTVLGMFLFSGDDVHKQISVLSGGEAARLLLAKITLLQHNFLIFDEPTNHLDMEATDALIEALKLYDGTILFVSHNRYFVSELASHIIEITPEHGLKSFNYRFDEYLERRNFDLLAPQKAAAEKLKEQEGKKNYEQMRTERRNQAQMAKKIAAAEEKCHKLELQIKEVHDQMAAERFFEITSAIKQKEIFERKAQLEKQLEQAYLDWELLN